MECSMVLELECFQALLASPAGVELLKQIKDEFLIRNVQMNGKFDPMLTVDGQRRVYALVMAALHQEYNSKETQ